MQDLKKICGPCPNVDSLLKPRKLINRLPDMDMWIVCKDGTTEIAQEELTRLLAENNMRTSDVDPILSIEEVAKIAQTLKSGKMPETILPMDVHIIEYSTLKELIERVPSTLKKSKEDQTIPYLPIQPKSYRKYWQFDDSAYNYVYDYLTAFTEFNFEEKLQESLIRSRKEVFENNSLEELFEFALQAATPANFRRFQEPQLEEKFRMRVQRWQGIPVEQEKELDEDYEIEL